MKKLIDYSTRFPKSDDHNTGYKYPFNSTEILCTENITFYNKLMTEKIIKEKNEKNKKAKDFMKRIHKGGFFEVFFKAIKKAEGNEQELQELEINNDNDNESNNDSETEEEKDIDIFKNIKIPENFFKNKKRKRSEDKNDKKDKKKINIINIKIKMNFMMIINIKIKVKKLKILKNGLYGIKI